MPQTALTPAIRDEIERLGRADIMVGIPSFKNAATIGYVVRAAQAGLVQYFPDLKPVLVESDVVRVGAFIRPPIDSWVSSWRSMGFAGLTYKAANSRYRSGEPNPDWAISGMPRR